MPRGASLPTPASSTDIKGQDGSKMASLQLSFELPPPAVTGNEPNALGTPFPSQASETVKSRRRSSAANGPQKDQFALPPPPTRSRKIIQMKPREEPAAAATASGSKAAPKGNTATGSATPVAGTKRKQPSATSAAGRKIARKTAHSLIERRRRSKMNEEFAILKSLIPACTGEMHKLAILQASIEYVRYLEDCVAKLKAQHGAEARSDSEPATAQPRLPSPSFGGAYSGDHSYAPTAGSCSPDMDMTSSSGAPSPGMTPVAGRSQRPSISPALLPEDSRNRQNSYSSISTEHRLHGYSTPAATSPVFGPQAYADAHRPLSAYGSALTSPALPPQRDLDQEATAALLMLNQTDRRTSSSAAPGRGMSVKDLLSS
ncbi:Transcriptional regulator of form adherence 6 [Madurella fahalii]|uniref:Transcriptional regulator of form adherence 6 n=1 Tax=Madurella fahalii TaxID=1157608 RepID=A0ABQ0G027_9PEZI